jgi:deoxycytidylate deaminase
MWPLDLDPTVIIGVCIVSTGRLVSTGYAPKIKGWSTAISFKKKAIVHHAPKRITPHTNNAHGQHTLQDTTPWEKSQKKATAAYAVVANVVPGQRRNPLQAAQVAI